MASSAFLRLAILIGILSISATARPCKTFFISSYSVSFDPQNPNPNPNPNPNEFSSGFITVFTEIRQFNPYRRPYYRPQLMINRRIFPASVKSHQVTEPERSAFFPFAYDFGSFRDRTKDILSVVVALLFGVGCGALTAATMYLFWAIFAYRNGFPTFNHFEDEETDSDDDASPKKMGYVKIPAPAFVHSAPKPTKEVA